VPFALEAPAAAFAAAHGAPGAARFAIETALLAVLAQRRRTRVAGLLRAGPFADLTCAPIVDDVAQARAAVACGARCLKLKLEAADLDVVRAIARAVPGIGLRVDANRGWPRAEVHARLAALAGLPIEYVEEPCRDAHELLATPLACRIALDESLVELGDPALARALASPRLAALVVKPTLLGGFARCLELARAARRAGVAAIVSHALEGPIGFAACRELAHVIGAEVPIGLAPHPALDRFAEAA